MCTNPRLTQRVLDTLESFLVIRARDEHTLEQFARSSIVANLLSPKPAAVFYHVPKVWKNKHSGWELSYFKGSRNVVFDSSSKIDRAVAEEFFRYHDRNLEEELVRNGYINGAGWNLRKPILYVRKDCIHCCHIKPMACWLNRRNLRIQIFSTTYSDFPPQTPVIRAVPQILSAGVPSPEPVLLANTSDFLDFLRTARLISSEESVALENYAKNDLPRAYQLFLDQAVSYYEGIVPPNSIASPDLEERADAEIYLWTKECYDIGEYLKALQKMTDEFSSWALKINKWSSSSLGPVLAI